MKPFARILPIAVVMLIAATAAAQPATTPPGPPQNYDWNDLSHINGQLVKVGEKNDYIIPFRKTVISANPIGWILGFYGVSVSRGLTQNLAVRFDANFMHPVGSEITGVELGVGLPVYLRRTYQGPYLEPGVIVRTFRDGESSDYHSDTSTMTTIGPQCLLGWAWMFDSGFNLAMAAGVGRNINASGDNSEGEIFANGYFRVGYAF
jgi:hypothetical protein